jgi:hypothetical protein
MRTSMQKDFDAGRPLELDAIAGGDHAQRATAPYPDARDRGTRPARGGTTRCICGVPLAARVSEGKPATSI